MKKTSTFLAGLAVILFLLGYLGHLHPILDSIALGRWVALYTFLFLLFLRAALGRHIVFATVTVFAVLLLAVSQRLGLDGQEGPVRVYTKNLYYLTIDVEPVVADIRTTDPDVIVLQEVSPRNRHIISEFAATHPHAWVCPWQEWNGMAILSRWPVIDGSQLCSQDRALIRAKLDRPEGAFWMIGAHLQHPWPDIQWPLLEASLPVISNLDAPAIVAGDFNTLYWTAAAQEVGRLTRTRPIRTKNPTYFLWNVGLHLDQVWAGSGHAEARPLLGSDHRGILASVWP